MLTQFIVDRSIIFFTLYSFVRVLLGCVLVGIFQRNRTNRRWVEWMDGWMDS